MVRLVLVRGESQASAHGNYEHGKSDGEAGEDDAAHYHGFLGGVRRKEGDEETLAVGDTVGH